MNRTLQYKQFLRSQFWRDLSAQKRRIVRRCQLCGTKHRLQAHHKFYRENWYDTKLSDLMVMCRVCHKREHRKLKLPDVPMAPMSPDKVNALLWEQYNRTL
jgi:5-methylcytosine-specific restriction endonuclease McrA